MARMCVAGGCALRLLAILVLCSNECISATNSQQEPKLVYVNILYRHGARTPNWFYPYDPYQYDKEFEKLGELTEIGKMQHVILGMYLRNRYGNLLADPGLIHVQSTNVPRVVESARCNLAAMFPSKGAIFFQNGVRCFTTVPFHYRYHNALQNRRCPASDTHVINKVQKDVSDKLKSIGNKELLDTLFYYTGWKGESTEASNWVRECNIFDALLIEEKDFDLKLDEWTKKVYPQKLKDVAIIYYSMFTWDDKMKLLTSGPLLKEMVSNMESKMKKETSLNAHIYAAHDSTIVNLLNTIGVYDKKHLPGYAACVMLELWNVDDGYYVKLYYKESIDDDAKLLRLQNCDTFCPFSKFVENYRKYIPEDWKEECEKKGPDS